MTELSTLSVAASGMEAQRAVLDVDARNVAAAETTGTFDRLIPRFAVAGDSGAGDANSLEVIGSEEDDAPFVRFVGTTVERGSGVDAIQEMVAILNAQRAYEANASVFDAGKRLAERTIDAGRP
jgi:flagellar basal-body rod protein FlgC